MRGFAFILVLACFAASGHALCPAGGSTSFCGAAAVPEFGEECNCAAEHCCGQLGFCARKDDMLYYEQACGFGCQSAHGTCESDVTLMSERTRTRPEVPAWFMNRTVGNALSLGPAQYTASLDHMWPHYLMSGGHDNINIRLLAKVDDGRFYTYTRPQPLQISQWHEYDFTERRDLAVTFEINPGQTVRIWVYGINHCTQLQEATHLLFHQALIRLEAALKDGFYAPFTAEAVKILKDLDRKTKCCEGSVFGDVHTYTAEQLAVQTAGGEVITRAREFVTVSPCIGKHKEHYNGDYHTWVTIRQVGFGAGQQSLVSEA